jgi:hypothetical protein
MVGIAGSTAFHVIVGAALILGLRTTVPFQPPLTEIRLISPIAVGLEPRPLPAAAQHKRKPGKVEQRGTASSPPATRPAATVTPAASPASTPSEPALSADVGQALRAIVGCERPDVYGLSQAERAKCRDRFAAIGRSAPTYAVLPSDATEAAALEHSGRVNEAWRNYRAGDGPYPGLRTFIPALRPLFGSEPIEPKADQ